ncbi:MAG: DUF115 domain-containing protein [Herbinix sp.]|nr:DUF115 domain-containing protein [Herbinix sp.]
MNFYDINLQMIKEKRKYLYECLMECDFHTEKNLLSNINSIETKDGNRAIVLEKEGNITRLNSAYRPQAEAEKWAGQFDFNNLDIVVSMFGFGNGIFAREIMKRLGEKNILLIVEPSFDIFMHTLENYDITDILSETRISISIEGINKQEYSTLVDQCVNWINLNTQIICAHPQYDKLFIEEYDNFNKTLRDVKIRETVNKNTEAYWGIRMTKNEIKNLKFLKECNILSDFIEDIPKDLPAIIVSAGPSLDKNIQYLKMAKGKAIIFAVDTALKYLLKHDIMPDFIVTLDAAKSPKHFADDRFKEIPLLCKSVSNPGVLELHKGRKILFSNEEFIDTIYKRLGKKQVFLHTGGSVSTAAYSICVALEFKRIIFIGQDLCYNGDYSHAGGVINNPHGSGERVMMVEDNNGNMVKARHDWYTYLIWLEDAIELCSHIDVINATEGGAKIKGAKVMTLSDAIDQYCNREIDVIQIVSNKKPTFSQEELGYVSAYFKESALDLEWIANKAKRSLAICNKLIIAAEKGKIGRLENQALAKKISVYNKEMSDKSVYQLLNDYISEVTTKHLDTINQLTDDIKVNQIKTYTISREVYKAIQEAAGVLKPLLEEAIAEFNVNSLAKECEPLEE